MEAPLVDTPRAPHPLRRRFAILLAAAAIGGGSGAGVVAATAGSSSTTTATIAAAAATPVSSTTATSLTVGEIYAKTAQGVVEVEVTSASTTPFGGQTQTSTALGTGFVYDTVGDIVTNYHVVEGATTITVKLADGKKYTATVVGTDPSTDVAVVHVDAPASELHPLALADSSSVVVGDTAVAIGDPFGLDGTVTSGIVSAVGRTITAPNGAKIRTAIQTDAAINHGNSGGPLLDDQGQVIGITSQIESTSGDNAGVGFAVSSNTVRASVSSILA